MSNLCFNEVVICGTGVDEIFRIYLKGNIFTLNKLQEELGFECENWGRGCDSELTAFDRKEDQIIINCCTANGDIPKFWDALCKKFNTTWCSFSSNEEDGYWIRNDSEGKFFPQRYVADIHDTNSKNITPDIYTFTDIESARKFLGIAENTDEDEISEIIEDYGNFYKVDIV